MNEQIDLRVKVEYLTKLIETMKEHIELMDKRLVMAEDYLKAQAAPRDCFEDV